MLRSVAHAQQNRGQSRETASFFGKLRQRPNRDSRRVAITGFPDVPKPACAFKDLVAVQVATTPHQTAERDGTGWKIGILFRSRFQADVDQSRVSREARFDWEFPQSS
jgi:hypothetical protein